MSTYITTWVRNDPVATYDAHVDRVSIGADSEGATVGLLLDLPEAIALRDQMTAAIELAQEAKARSAPIAELGDLERQLLGGVR
ncbi:hypothetical protein [Nocardia sp. NPDC055049]